ncbi:MAG TPA: hypothetical protein VJ302_19800 [Blastocatellia bacterium]|nr:hypothetical protein [Blastocatellia bacterium]
MAEEQREESGNVSFRLSAKHINKLTARADRTGISRHQQAQAIVEAALDERDEEAMLTSVELADLRAEVGAIRAGLMKILTGLVTTSSAGKMPLESARAFVKEAFARKEAGKN